MSSLLLALLSFACSPKPKQDDGGQMEQNTALEASVRGRTTAENLNGQHAVAARVQQDCTSEYIDSSNEAWRDICFRCDSRDLLCLTSNAAHVLNDSVSDSQARSICTPAWECFDARIWPALAEYLDSQQQP